MIRIILYSGCMLTDNYQNVFSYKKNSSGSYIYSPFEYYLDSLYHKTFDIDTIYQEDNSVLNFKLDSTSYGTGGNSLSIYSFNYMEIQSIGENNEILLKRYAFINSIKIGNDIAQISYKIDVWHTYVNNIKGINLSFLKGLRLVKDKSQQYPLPSPMRNLTYYNLPIDFAGNNKLIIPTDSNTYGVDIHCILIVQVQFYLGQKLGDASTTYSKYILIDRLANNDTSLIKFKDVHNVINNLCKATQVQESYDGSAIKLFFDIGNIYVLPFTEEITNKFGARNEYKRFDYKDNAENIYTACHFRDLLSYSDYDFTLPFNIFNFTFANNFKTLSIGNFSTRIKVIPNGTDISVSMMCSLRSDNFKIYLNVENKFIDISNDYYYEPLQNYLSGSTIAQQRLALSMKNLENNYGIRSSLINNIGGMIKGIGGVASGAISGNIGGAISGETSYIQNANRLAMDLDYYSEKRKLINEPIYNNAEIIKANDIAVLNARSLIFALNIDSDNDNYVKNSVNNMGYNVYEYIINWNELGINIEPQLFYNKGIYFNTIQFGSCDLYGDFPSDIAKQLNKILEKGVKIWYYHDISYALEHDNYLANAF